MKNEPTVAPASAEASEKLKPLTKKERALFNSIVHQVAIQTDPQIGLQSFICGCISMYSALTGDNRTLGALTKKRYPLSVHVVLAARK